MTLQKYAYFRVEHALISCALKLHYTFFSNNEHLACLWVHNWLLLFCCFKFVTLKLITLKELNNGLLIFAEIICVDGGLNLKVFCGTNFCGCLNSKLFATLIFANEQRWRKSQFIPMNHCSKISKLINNKMNECYFIDEKLMHMKVSLHIIIYHLHSSHCQWFQRHCRLDPDQAPLLTLCNKCRSLLLFFFWAIPHKETFCIPAICTDILLVLFKTYLIYFLE